MKVCVINGVARSGKDTFVELFAKHYPGLCLNWSTIDIVKEIAKNHLGWDGSKSDSSRLFLSEFKRIWNEFNNGAFLFMVNKINEHYHSLSKQQKKHIIYFIHCREPKDIKQFKEVFKEQCFTVIVSRKSIDTPNNNSDRNVSKFLYDYEITNNGTLENLEKKANDLIFELKN